LQSAQDARFSIDGVEMASDRNEVTDAVEGVTINLYTSTQGAAKVDIARQSSAIRDNLNALVKSFNEFQDSVKVLQDAGSKVETYGGALRNDSLTRRIQSQIRDFFTQDAKPAGEYIKAARDVGLSLDRFGKLSLDENKLNQALDEHYDEVVLMFTANKNDKSLYSKSDAGLAGGAVRSLDQMLRSTSLIEQQSNNETKKIDGYKSQLEKLQSQMDRLLERYMNQFTIMDNIVGSSNSTRQSLKNSLQQLSGNNNN
jgi:flagellar hook-associated protein 2